MHEFTHILPHAKSTCCKCLRTELAFTWHKHVVIKQTITIITIAKILNNGILPRNHIQRLYTLFFHALIHTTYTRDCIESTKKVISNQFQLQFINKNVLIFTSLWEKQKQQQISCIFRHFACFAYVYLRICVYFLFMFSFRFFFISI